MRFLSVFVLLFSFLLSPLRLSAQTDSLVNDVPYHFGDAPDTAAAATTDTTLAAVRPHRPDTLLFAVLWRETTPGSRAGYALRLAEFGSFEEDAGENYDRASRYLLGRWETDSTLSRLTLAVDYFLGRKLVHSRYRNGQDYYLDYEVVALTPDTLELRDETTGKVRTFTAEPLADYKDAGERKAEAIEIFGNKRKGGLELPKGW